MQRLAALGRSRQPESAQVAVGLALVMKASDGLLADVAALLEVHGGLVEPGLLGGRLARDVDPEAETPRFDPQALRRALRPLLDSERGACLGRIRGADVHAEV